MKCENCGWSDRPVAEDEEGKMVCDTCQGYVIFDVRGVAGSGICEHPDDALAWHYPDGTQIKLCVECAYEAGFCGECGNHYWTSDAGCYSCLDTDDRP